MNSISLRKRSLIILSILALIMVMCGGGATEEEATEEVVEESEETAEEVAETTEEASEEATSEEAEEAEAPAIKFREDIMLRVMEEYGIEDRDAFLAHSMNFDLDDNGYLKKAEFVEAAKAFTSEAGQDEIVEEEPSDAEEAVEEEATEEIAEEAKYEDGLYFAKSDAFSEKSGWKEAVTIEVKDGIFHHKYED